MVGEQWRFTNPTPDDAEGSLFLGVGEARSETEDNRTRVRGAMRSAPRV